MKEKEAIRIINILMPTGHVLLISAMIILGVCGAAAGIFKFVEFISSLI